MIQVWTREPRRDHDCGKAPPPGPTERSRGRRLPSPESEHQVGLEPIDVLLVHENFTIQSSLSLTHAAVQLKLTRLK